MRIRALCFSIAMAATTMTANASDTRITLYSSDFNQVSQSQPSSNMPGLALINRRLQWDLQRGNNAMSWDELPLAIDVGTVELSPESKGMRIMSQRYDFSLLGQAQLLNQAVGKHVVVEQISGGTANRYEGILLAAGNGITLQQSDGRIRVLANYSNFELAELPTSLSPRPTLRWQIDSPTSGRENFQLTYATGGMAWQAEYIARLESKAQSCRMAWSGAAQVVNRSGIDFSSATLTLIAGMPNQARHSGQIMVTGSKVAMRAEAAYDSAVEAEVIGESHAYPLKHRVDLPNGSMQRIPLINDVEGVACQREYHVGQSNLGYRPAHPSIHSTGESQELPVSTRLVFKNDKASGLGVALPAGRVRVFQAETKGDALIGEAQLRHTANGQSVHLDLAQTFDLNATKKEVKSTLSDDRLSYTETLEFTLSNAKPEPVNITLDDVLPRWQDWEIIESSHDWSQLNAQAIRFNVAVAAGKTSTVRYTVRYRWPSGYKP